MEKHSAPQWQQHPTVPCPYQHPAVPYPPNAYFYYPPVDPRVAAVASARRKAFWYRALAYVFVVLGAIPLVILGFAAVLLVTVVAVGDKAESLGLHPGILVVHAVIATVFGVGASVMRRLARQELARV